MVKMELSRMGFSSKLPWLLGSPRSVRSLAWPQCNLWFGKTNQLQSCLQGWFNRLNPSRELGTPTEPESELWRSGKQVVAPSDLSNISAGGRVDEADFTHSSCRTSQRVPWQKGLLEKMCLNWISVYKSGCIWGLASYLKKICSKAFC